MAGAVGIVFGLCVLSFTMGAALMYVLVRRREDAATAPAAAAEAADPAWVAKPVLVEPVEAEYDSRPIHRNPVRGLPRMEPALAALAERVSAEPVVKPEPVEAEPEPVVMAGPEPEPVTEPEPVEVVEPVAEEPVEEPEPEPEPAPPPVVHTELPPPAAPQPVEHTTWVEREDFRQRYLRTFEEVRRKAGSN